MRQSPDGLIWPQPEEGAQERIGTVFTSGTYATENGKIPLDLKLMGAFGWTPPKGNPHGPTPTRNPPSSSRRARVTQWQQTMTNFAASLAQFSRGRYVLVHPDTAKPLGIAHGDTVRIKTATGSVEAVAELTASIRPGIIFTPSHFTGTSPPCRDAEQADQCHPAQLLGPRVGPVQRRGMHAGKRRKGRSGDFPRPCAGTLPGGPAATPQMNFGEEHAPLRDGHRRLQMPELQGVPDCLPAAERRALRPPATGCGNARTRLRPPAGATSPEPVCTATSRPALTPAPRTPPYKAEDGVVMVDETRCIACGSCMRACPYQARHIDPARRVVDKCDYCASSRAEGMEPACVSVCTTRARVFGDVDDPQSPVSKVLGSHKVTFVEAKDAPTSRPSPI